MRRCAASRQRHFEAEEDDSAQVLAQVPEGVLSAPGDKFERVAGERAEPPNDKDGRAHGFNDVVDVGEELAVGQDAAAFVSP